MPFTAEELKTWVGGLGIPDDKRAAVLEALGTPDVLNRVGDSVLSQREFSRKMDELRANETKLQADLAAKIKDEENKTLSYKTSVDSWKGEKEKLLTDAIAKREAAEAALKATQDKIRGIAPNFGITDEDLKPIFDAAPVTTTRQEPGRDFEGKFVSKTELDEIAKQWVKLPAVMVGIQQEHLRLFGAAGIELDPVKLIEDAQNNKLTIRQQWEKEYKVSEKRAEIAKTVHDKEIADAEARGREAARSEIIANNPGAVGPGVGRREVVGSPVLDQARKQMEQAKKDGRISVPTETAASAAARAWQEGKYSVGKES